jgi:ABC-2 type transport system permease protein
MKRFIANFKKYRYLLMELTKKEVKLKYRNSVLGLLWTLIEPFLTMIVLTIVFGTIMGRTKNFAVYILIGKLIFSYFSNGTKQELKSIRKNGSMIRKVYVPKYMYPLSASMSTYITFLFSLIVLVGVAAYEGIKPTIYTLGAIVPLITVFLLVTSIGFFVSTLDVFFRDLEYIWNVFTMLIMYMSAIFYDSKKLLDSQYAFMLKYNPLFAIITNFRAAVIDAKGLNLYYTWYPLAVSAFFLIFGLLLFYKKQDRFVLYV